MKDEVIVTSYLKIKKYTKNSLMTTFITIKYKKLISL
jgi:hypothetical protein